MRKMILAAALALTAMFAFAGSPAEAQQVRCIIVTDLGQAPCQNRGATVVRPPATKHYAPVVTGGSTYVTLRLTDANWHALQQWGQANGFRYGECWWNANPTSRGMPKTSVCTKQGCYVRVDIGVTYVVRMDAWTGESGAHTQTFGPFYDSDQGGTFYGM